MTDKIQIFTLKRISIKTYAIHQTPIRYKRIQSFGNLFLYFHENGHLDFEYNGAQATGSTSLTHCHIFHVSIKFIVLYNMSARGLAAPSPQLRTSPLLTRYRSVKPCTKHVRHFDGVAKVWKYV